MKKTKPIFQIITFAIAVVIAFSINANNKLTMTAYGQVPDNPSTYWNDGGCNLGTLLEWECGQSGLYQCTVIIDQYTYPAYTLDNGSVCSMPKLYW